MKRKEKWGWSMARAFTWVFLPLVWPAWLLVIFGLDVSIALWWTAASLVLTVAMWIIAQTVKKPRGWHEIEFKNWEGHVMSGYRSPEENEALRKASGWKSHGGSE